MTKYPRVVRPIKVGVFNTYGNVQLKCSRKNQYITFEIGDKTDLNDGIYLGHWGYVVIHNKKLLATYEFITTSSGRIIRAGDLYSASLTTIDKLKDLRTFKAK